MTEYQRLFLVQARADLEVFRLLREKPELPPCHALHYLQMATELLAKAYVWKNGPPPKDTHKAFAGFVKSLSTNRKVQRRLGYEKKNESWQHLIRKSYILAKGIEQLAPAIAKDGPNPEYPWPRDAPKFVPAEHLFDIWQELEETAIGRQFLEFTISLFAVADAFL